MNTYTITSGNLVKEANNKIEAYEIKSDLEKISNEKVTVWKNVWASNHSRKVSK